MKFILALLILSPAYLYAEMNTAGDAFVRAVHAGNMDAIETLLSSGLNPNLPVHGYTPLWFALQSGHAGTVGLLLDRHADPNLLLGTGPFEATPLQLAVELDNPQIVSKLIAAGADVNAKGSLGDTALHMAVRGNGHLDALRLLMDRGADPNVRDREGASPLDYAVWHGALDSTALLLAHGARLNEPDTKTGATPINEAAFMGNTHIVQYLLRFHPDLSIADKRGYSPLENAVRMGKEDSALLLIEAEPAQPVSGRLEKAMESAIRLDRAVLVAALVANGVSADAKLPSGATALDAAAFAGAGKTVQALLGHHADPNLEGRSGSSPLEDASLRGFDSIAGLLIDHGALVNHVNADSGATALYVAASFGKIEVVKLLLKRGADPSLCSKNGKSPYRAAVDNGFTNVADELRVRGGRAGCER